MSEVDQEGPTKSALKKKAKEEEKLRKKAEKAAKTKEAEQARAAAEEPVGHVIPIFTRLIYSGKRLQDYAAAHYGKLPLHQSQSRPNRKRTDIATLSAKNDTEHVLIRARIQTSRLQSNKMVFLNLRQRTDTIQAVLSVTDKQVSKQMVKWAAGLSDESIVLIFGTVVKSPEPIKSCSIDDVEIHVNEVCTLSFPS